MYPVDVYDKLRACSEKTLFLLRELLPRMAPVAQDKRWTGDQRKTLANLLTATARSSESALLLTAYAQLWDAEVLVRSVTEGTLKFAYLLQAAASFDDRHREYGHDLFRIGLLKDHAKYAELLALLPDSHDEIWRPLRERLLSDVEREEIGNAYPRPVRSALEGRWGFTGLIGALGNGSDPFFRGITGLASGYAMASHIAHADSIGTSIPLEIDNRSSERRDTHLLAHGVRLMSDVVSCFHIRLAVAYRFIDHDPEPVEQTQNLLDELRASFGCVYEEWMSSEYGSS